MPSDPTVAQTMSYQYGIRDGAEAERARITALFKCSWSDGRCRYGNGYEICSNCKAYYKIKRSI